MTYSRAQGGKQNTLQQDLTDTCITHAEYLGQITQLVENKYSGTFDTKDMCQSQWGSNSQTKTLWLAT